VKLQVTGEFNPDAELPFELRLRDFEMAMQDVYDFFYDVNRLLLGKGLHRLDDMLRPAAMSGMLSDMLTASMAKHSRVLVENRHFNGHPDLLVQAGTLRTRFAPASMGSKSKALARRVEPSIHTGHATSGWRFSSIRRIMLRNRLSSGRRCDSWRCIWGA